MVVFVGETVNVCVVAPPGDQRYVPPLGLAVAVKVAEPPGQIVLEFTLNVGEEETVTTPEAGVLAHDPFE
jgi:hypothetical protein